MQLRFPLPIALSASSPLTPLLSRCCRAKVEAGELSEPQFMDELQRRMEVVVLGLQVRRCLLLAC